MGIFKKTARTASASSRPVNVPDFEEAESYRVPPGFSIAPPPMAEYPCSQCQQPSACDCQQQFAAAPPASGQPEIHTTVGPNGETITTEVYHTAYACFDPNCQGGESCTHQRYQIGGDQEFLAQQQMPQQQQQQHAQQVPQQRTVTTTTTTTTTTTAPQQQQQQVQQQVLQPMYQGAAPMIGTTVGTAPQTLVYGTSTQPLQPQGSLMVQQQPYGSAQVSGNIIYTVQQPAVATLQPVGPAQMVGAPSMVMGGVMGGGGGGAPVLVNKSGRPMPATVNGIPVIVPTMRGLQGGHIRY